MLKISVSYLIEFNQYAASQILGKSVQPGIYRFVEDRGGIDELVYLGEIEEIDLSSDIGSDADGLFIERVDGVLQVNDNFCVCPPAQYIRVGKS